MGYKFFILSLTYTMQHTLKIYHNANADNPRENRDWLPALITFWGRDYWDIVYWIDVEEIIKWITNTKTIKKIFDWLELDEENFKEWKEDWYNRKDYVIEKMSDMDGDIDITENIIIALWYEYYRRNSRGYSQGDYFECILIATPERLKETWIKKENVMQSLKDNAKLYDARAWGDVYWYKITEHRPLYREDGTLSDTQEEVELDSCRGYYWDDWLEQIYKEIEWYNITREQFETAKENMIF